jgi:hypothetical protein
MTLTVAALATAFFSSSAAAQLDVGLVSDELQIQATVGLGNARPTEMCAWGNGLLVWNDYPANNVQLIYVDRMTGATSPVTDEASLLAAMDVANGAAPPPTNFTPQSVVIAADGDIIVSGDGSSPETTAVYGLDPMTFAITVIAGANPVSQTPIEGHTHGCAVIGNRIYLWSEAGFGGSDNVMVLDTNDPAAPNAVATVFTSGVAIDLVVGSFSPGDARLNAWTVDANGDILVTNSQAVVSNDDIVKINVATGVPGTPSVYVSATDVEADLGTSDIGWTFIEVLPSGDLLLGNCYGTGSIDDAIVHITNIAPPFGDATVVLSEAQAVADPQFGTGTNLFYPESGSAIVGAALYLCQMNAPESILSITSLPAVFGAGCGSPAPTLGYRGVPIASTTFTPEISGAAPSSPAVMAVGLSNTVFIGLGIPLPFDLSGFGPGCNLLVSPDGTIFAVTDTSGAASVPVTMPPLPFVGLNLYFQWLVFAGTPAVLEGTDGLRVSIH